MSVFLGVCEGFKTGLAIASMGTLSFVTPDAIARKRLLSIRLSAFAPGRSNDIGGTRPCHVCAVFAFHYARG
jgi:hypothetical protein